MMETLNIQNVGMISPPWRLGVLTRETSWKEASIAIGIGSWGSALWPTEAGEWTRLSSNTSLSQAFDSGTWLKSAKGNGLHTGKWGLTKVQHIKKPGKGSGTGTPVLRPSRQLHRGLSHGVTPRLEKMLPKMTECQSAFFSSPFPTEWNVVLCLTKPTKLMKEHECHLPVCNSWRSSASTSPTEISRGVYSSTSQAECRLGRKSLAFPESNPRSATMPRWWLK